MLECLDIFPTRKLKLVPGLPHVKPAIRFSSSAKERRKYVLTKTFASTI
jgi:hypothetical protein